MGKEIRLYIVLLEEKKHVFLRQHDRNHCVLFKLVETNEDMLFVLNGLFVWCCVFIHELYTEWTSKAH